MVETCGSYFTILSMSSLGYRPGTSQSNLLSCIFYHSDVLNVMVVYLMTLDTKILSAHNTPVGLAYETLTELIH